MGGEGGCNLSPVKYYGGKFVVPSPGRAVCLGGGMSAAAKCCLWG